MLKPLLLWNNLFREKLFYKILVLLSSPSPIPPSKGFYIPAELLGLFFIALALLIIEMSNPALNM